MQDISVKKKLLGAVLKAYQKDVSRIYLYSTYKGNIYLTYIHKEKFIKCCQNILPHLLYYTQSSSILIFTSLKLVTYI